MKDGHSVEEPQPRRRQRPPAPSAQNIAGAHGRQVACWVCDGTEMLERAHIVPWVIDPRNDPLAYVLLCEAHHEDAPDTGSPEVFWDWIAVARGEKTLPPWPDPVGTVALVEWAEDHMGTEESDRPFRLASVLAARELGGVETHGASHSPGTQVALFQKALSLMEKWAREGSLMPRAEHPDWFLTEQEHRLYQRMTPATMASGHNV